MDRIKAERLTVDVVRNGYLLTVSGPLEDGAQGLAGYTQHRFVFSTMEKLCEALLHNDESIKSDEETATE